MGGGLLRARKRPPMWPAGTAEKACSGDKGAGGAPAVSACMETSNSLQGCPREEGQGLPSATPPERKALWHTRKHFFGEGKFGGGACTTWLGPCAEPGQSLNSCLEQKEGQTAQPLRAPSKWAQLMFLMSLQAAPPLANDGSRTPAPMITKAGT